jgi:hypothetical protein
MSPSRTPRGARRTTSEPSRNWSDGTGRRCSPIAIRVVTVAGLAGIALAFGLAFGLGSRDIIRNIMVGFYARKTFQIGKEIEIRGETGKLQSITPTQTILQQGGRRVAIKNSVFPEEVVRQ